MVGAFLGGYLFPHGGGRLTGRSRIVKEALNPNCTVIIVNWNGRDSLKKLLESIAKFEDVKKLQIIISDNGSVDGSLEESSSAGERSASPPPAPATVDKLSKEGTKSVAIGSICLHSA